MNRLIRCIVGRSRGLPLVLLIGPLLAGCGDTFGPRPWSDRPDTVGIYSLARPELVGLPGAYDFVQMLPVVVELQRGGGPGVFDIGFSEMDGGFVALPAGMFESLTIQPGLQPVETETFESLTRAPPDGYIDDEAVPLDSGAVYAVRTRTAPNGCRFFGKFEVLELNAVDGIVEIRAVASPVCNNRDLVPPDQD